MPIYEYQCLACEADFEELVRSSEAAEIQCPRCKSQKVSRRLSVFAARDATTSSSLPASGSCGRCGDPRGSCQT
jgi:putative FmdB family regulatory protein